MTIAPNTSVAILKGLCPRCGQGPLFDGYIALKNQCPACGLDYAIFDAGDGPMVFGILIVGAIVCGLALWVEFTFQPPLWVHAVLWLPLICILTAIFLRLSKSALLVLQYKHKAGEGRL
ncbi:MAG TPA: DUF983 domain-containing protein [Rhizomicrobium sp.]|nr:DUF983 domain-containing protein [Rhizomicrobium sp.]